MNYGTVVLITGQKTVNSTWSTTYGTCGEVYSVPGSQFVLREKWDLWLLKHIKFLIGTH